MEGRGKGEDGKGREGRKGNRREGMNWKDDTASDGREVYRVEPPTIVKVGARLGPGKATLDSVCHPPPPSPWGVGPHGFFLTTPSSFSSKRRLQEKVSWEFQVFTLCGDLDRRVAHMRTHLF